MSRDVDPELPLDLCIVGAGIAGTVAAFRARELGLRFRLIERESALHRQRPLEEIDRADTVVLADLPPGSSPLIADACLAAASQSGLADWIEQLSGRGVPLEVGCDVFAIELETERESEGPAPEPGTLANVDHIYRLRMIDRTTGRERRVRARHVVFAIGRAADEGDSIDAGSPASALASAVGAPALIVGDGQTAVDALLALAEAKAQASDPDPVYWTPGFRGESGGEARDEIDVGTGDRFLEVLRSHSNIRTLAPASSVREQTEVDGAVRVVAEFRAVPSAGRFGGAAASRVFPARRSSIRAAPRGSRRSVAR